MLSGQKKTSNRLNVLELIRDPNLSRVHVGHCKACLRVDPFEGHTGFLLVWFGLLARRWETNRFSVARMANQPGKLDMNSHTWSTVHSAGRGREDWSGEVAGSSGDSGSLLASSDTSLVWVSRSRSSSVCRRRRVFMGAAASSSSPLGGWTLQCSVAPD